MPRSAHIGQTLAPVVPGTRPAPTKNYTEKKMTLTHFQKTVKRTLGLTESGAQTVQVDWPLTEKDLEDLLFEWADERVDSLRLMASVPIIWGRKPLDPSEAEGRDVLFHPVNGSAIGKQDYLYGISWEVLAFLRWALQKNLLIWTDDVTIAREVQHSDIASLPRDRFHAKNKLPKSDGLVDWSDLALAKAKAFITTGANDSAVPSSLGENEAPYRKDDLVSVLLSIPALSDSDSRNHLLRGLPRVPASGIRRNTAPRADLNNIVEAARGWGEITNGAMAINVVIDNALRLVDGTAKASELKGFRV